MAKSKTSKRHTAEFPTRASLTSGASQHSIPHMQLVSKTEALVEEPAGPS